MTTAAQTTPALSTLNKTGPPYAILLLDSILGLITVVAVVVAWRTTRRGPCAWWPAPGSSR